LKGIDFHGLRFQLLLVFKLFVGCIVVAVLMIWQKPWVESFLKEKYFSVPNDLNVVLEQAKMGALILEDYQKIPVEKRSLFYDHWMTSDPVNKKMPRVLLATDYPLFSGRLERTLVCGSLKQRKKALYFAELSENKKLITILKKAKSWCRRRKLNSLVSELEKTISRLQVHNNKKGD